LTEDLLHKSEIVYFHPGSDCLLKPDVRVRLGLKETEDRVPICYCFGFADAMVVEKIRPSGKCTIPQCITAEVPAGNCACEICNPQGSCCLGNVNSALKRIASKQAPAKVTDKPKSCRSSPLTPS
jgi:hypothetical protein